MLQEVSTLQASTILVVTPAEVSPQGTARALNTLREVRTPVLGAVENTAYFECPCCGEKSELHARRHLRNAPSGPAASNGSPGSRSGPTRRSTPPTSRLYSRQWQRTSRRSYFSRARSRAPVGRCLRTPVSQPSNLTFNAHPRGTTAARKLGHPDPMRRLNERPQHLPTLTTMIRPACRNEHFVPATCSGRGRTTTLFFPPLILPLNCTVAVAERPVVSSQRI